MAEARHTIDSFQENDVWQERIRERIQDALRDVEERTGDLGENQEGRLENLDDRMADLEAMLDRLLDSIERRLDDREDD